MELKLKAQRPWTCTASVSVVHSRVRQSRQTKQHDLLSVLASGSVSAASVMNEGQVGSGREEGGSGNNVLEHTHYGRGSLTDWLPDTTSCSKY